MKLTLLLLGLVVTIAACSHSVVGEDTGQATSASQPLPSAGQACRCTSDLNTPPPDNCCSGDLACVDPEMPGRTTCDAIGCFRKGFCAERTTSSSSSNTSSSSSTSSSGGSSSGFPAQTPDECSPFKNPPQGTCAAGQECHLLRDHWGCI